MTPPAKEVLDAHTFGGAEHRGQHLATRKGVGETVDGDRVGDADGGEFCAAGERTISNISKSLGEDTEEYALQPVNAVARIVVRLPETTIEASAQTKTFWL